MKYLPWRITEKKSKKHIFLSNNYFYDTLTKKSYTFVFFHYLYQNLISTFEKYSLSLITIFLFALYLMINSVKFWKIKKRYLLIFCYT